MTKTTLDLKKPAANQGGDRYDGVLEGKPFVVYIPQTISRTNGVPGKKAKITIEVE